MTHAVTTRTLPALCAALLLSILPSIAIRAAANQTPASIIGAWLETPLVHWIYPPPNAEIDERAASVKILYFRADHKVVLLAAWLIEQQHPIRRTISVGDPQNVYFGTWSPGGDGWRIEYQLVERTISYQGEKLPGPLETHSLAFKSETLTLNGTRFLRAVDLDDTMAQSLAGAALRAADHAPSGQP